MEFILSVGILLESYSIFFSTSLLIFNSFFLFFSFSSFLIGTAFLFSLLVSFLFLYKEAISVLSVPILFSYSPAPIKALSISILAPTIFGTNWTYNTIPMTPNK